MLLRGPGAGNPKRGPASAAWPASTGRKTEGTVAVVLPTRSAVLGFDLAFPASVGSRPRGGARDDAPRLLGGRLGRSEGVELLKDRGPPTVADESPLDLALGALDGGDAVGADGLREGV